VVDIAEIQILIDRLCCLADQKIVLECWDSLWIIIRSILLADSGLLWSQIVRFIFYRLSSFFGIQYHSCENKIVICLSDLVHWPWWMFLFFLFLTVVAPVDENNPRDSRIILIRLFSATRPWSSCDHWPLWERKNVSLSDVTCARSSLRVGKRRHMASLASSEQVMSSTIVAQKARPFYRAGISDSVPMFLGLCDLFPFLSLSLSLSRARLL